jgi:hypothetical protein
MPAVLPGRTVSGAGERGCGGERRAQLTPAGVPSGVAGASQRPLRSALVPVSGTSGPLGLRTDKGGAGGGPPGWARRLEVDGLGQLLDPGQEATSSLPSALQPGRRWQTGPVSITYAGHTVGYTETKSGRRFIVQCSCGLGHPRWKGDTPSTKATENVAVIDCFRHLRKVRTEAQRAGKLTGQRASPIPKAQGSTLRIGT